MMIKPDPECIRFLDETVGDIPPTEAGKAHLTVCGSCRELRTTTERLQTARTAFPPAFFSGMKDRIVGSLASAPSSPEPVPRPTFRFTGIAAFAAVLLIAIFVGHSIHDSNRKPGSGEGVGKSEIVVPRGSRSTWDSPHGYHLDLAGPARIKLLDHGIEASEGDITVTVQPSPQGFTLRTPHGMLEVLGTKFRCLVDSQKTSVEVFSGTVRVVPREGDSFTLQATEKVDLVPSLAPKGGTQPMPPPDVEENNR